MRLSGLFKKKIFIFLQRYQWTRQQFDIMTVSFIRYKCNLMLKYILKKITQLHDFG